MSFLLLLSNQVGQSYVVEHLWEDANRLLKKEWVDKSWTKKRRSFWVSPGHKKE